MIKIFSLALQTLFGWTVITCGVPAEDFLIVPPGGFSQIDYVCIVEVNDQMYAARGEFFKVTKPEDKPKFFDGERKGKNDNPDLL